LKSKGDIQITICGYKGQGKTRRLGFYETYSGNDNSIAVQYSDKVAEFKFVLDSEYQKDKLIEFCGQNDFSYRLG
jgi:hypothetical protein